MSLTVDHVSFGYHADREILSDISITADSSEALFILGPNGTGKTTLLKCINHIITPRQGRVLIGEEDVAAMTPPHRARKIGYVPQYNNNVFGMSVIDIIMMGRIAFAGRRISSEDKDIVFDIIERMELQPFAFKDINQMSGGERQRVFIARALAQQPEFVILDEPTGSLDMKNQIFTLDLVTGLAHTKHIGVIMTIHDMNLTSLFADKVLMLKDSHIFANGTPQEVLTEENIRAVYGVETAITMEDGYTHVRLKK